MRRHFALAVHGAARACAQRHVAGRLREVTLGHSPRQWKCSTERTLCTLRDVFRVALTRDGRVMQGRNIACLLTLAESCRDEPPAGGSQERSRLGSGGTSGPQLAVTGSEGKGELRPGWGAGLAPVVFGSPLDAALLLMARFSRLRSRRAHKHHHDGARNTEAL